MISGSDRYRLYIHVYTMYIHGISSGPDIPWIYMYIHGISTNVYTMYIHVYSLYIIMPIYHVYTWYIHVIYHAYFKPQFSAGQGSWAQALRHRHSSDQEGFTHWNAGTGPAAWTCKGSLKGSGLPLPTSVGWLILQVLGFRPGPCQVMSWLQPPIHPWCTGAGVVLVVLSQSGPTGRNHDRHRRRRRHSRRC